MAHRSGLPSARLRRSMPDEVPLLLIGRLDGDLADDALVGIDRLVRVGGTEGLEDGFVDGAGPRMLPASGRARMEA